MKNSVSCNGECNCSSGSKYEPEKSTLLHEPKKSTLLHVLILLIFGQLLRDTISNCAVLSLSRLYLLHVANTSYLGLYNQAIVHLKDTDNRGIYRRFCPPKLHWLVTHSASPLCFRTLSVTRMRFAEFL